MSRAGGGAAATASPETTSPTLHLVVHNTNSSSTALVRSEPYGANSAPTDLGALVILAGLSQQLTEEQARIERRKQRLTNEKTARKKKFVDEAAFTSHGGGVFKISFVVWIRILDYLLCENTLAFIDSRQIEQIRASKFPISYSDRSQPLESALQNTVQTHSISRAATCLFSKKYQAEFEFSTLLDAALNADLAMVEKILTEASPENRQILLFSTGKSTITHLGIERTGTPLQMALYGHDEEMVAFIKRHMDPAEFQRQWEEVFGSDYNAFLVRQQTEATRLCGELENAFRAASATDVTNALNRVANTTSELQNTLNHFKDNLERYARENRVHNPYILQRLFEIYDTPTFDHWNKDCLLSQQAIGVAQKLSSPRWLQHLSQGLYYLVQNNEAARRSFGLRNSSRPVVDIRSLDRLGVDFCIHIFGGGWAERARRGQLTLGGRGAYKTYVEQKQQAFRTCYAANTVARQLLRNAVTISCC